MDSAQGQGDTLCQANRFLYLLFKGCLPTPPVCQSLQGCSACLPPSPGDKADVGWERIHTKKSREEIQKCRPPYRGDVEVLHRKQHLMSTSKGKKEAWKWVGSGPGLLCFIFLSFNTQRKRDASTVHLCQKLSWMQQGRKQERNVITRTTDTLTVSWGTTIFAEWILW